MTPTQPDVKLTEAQRRALEVLAEAGKPVRGSKQASRMKPTPLVNSIAAFSLIRFGLARAFMAPNRSMFTSGYDFAITDAGRQVLRG